MPSEIARGFLKGLQEREFAAAGVQPERYDKETFMRGHEHDPSYELVAKSLDLRPTPYEHPTPFAILHRLDNSLRAANARYPHFKLAEIQERVTLGTLPTTQFNASTIPVPDTNEFLIVFDPVFFAFIGELAEAIAPVLRPTGTSDRWKHIAQIQEVLQQDPFVVVRFFAMIESFLTKGRPFLPAPIAREDFFTVERLRNEATLFVLAHEYGHILLRHFEGRSFEGPDPKGWQTMWEYQQEHSADVLGSDLLRAVLESQGEEPAGCYLGADFFLAAVLLIEASREVLLTGQVRPLRPPPAELMGEGPMALQLAGNLGATHPKPFHRWWVLQAWLERTYPGDFSAIGAHSEFLFEGLQILFAASMQRLLQAHSAGFRPTREWRGYTLWEPKD